MTSEGQAELHWSRLRLIGRSPAHYHANADDEDSPARRFGSCVHVLALGGDVIRFPGQRKGNAWKAFQRLVAGEEYFVFDGARRGKPWTWAKVDAGSRVIVSSEDVVAAEAGRALQARRVADGRYLVPIVSAAEYEQAQLCAEAVRRCPPAREMLAGDHEVPLRWTLLGRACAGQLDVMGAHHVADLKTTTNSDPEWFGRHAKSMGYHGQLEWYREGADQNGSRVEERGLIAVETKRPFVVTCLRMTERAAEKGRRLVRQYMERLLACEQADEWPGYIQAVADFDIDDDFDWGAA